MQNLLFAVFFGIFQLFFSQFEGQSLLVNLLESAKKSLLNSELAFKKPKNFLNSQALRLESWLVVKVDSKQSLNKSSTDKKTDTSSDKPSVKTIDQKSSHKSRKKSVEQSHKKVSKASAKTTTEKLSGKSSSSLSEKEDQSSSKKSKPEKAQNTAQVNSEKNEETQASSPNVVSQKIKEVFLDFLDILENKSIESEEYTKAVKFLERSLYNEASFESLEMLAEAYKDKEDFQNQIKVLKILSANHPEKAKSFYLLGSAYHKLLLNKSYLEKRYPSLDSREEAKQKSREEAIENLNKAVKLDPKYVLAYEVLMDLLMETEPIMGEKIHTKGSLSVALDMLKKLRKNSYLIPLCKAYYDNQFLKKSRKVCATSVKKNPKDPISPFILALSLSDEKETQKKILKIADKFKDSFFIQYKTAFYFQDKDSKIAIVHFDLAHKLEPDNVSLNKIMAQFFFDNKEEERAYDYFLKACLMTDGKFLKEFRKATLRLPNRQRVDLVSKYKKGIDECFTSAKKRIKNRKDKA